MIAWGSNQYGELSLKQPDDKTSYSSSFKNLNLTSNQQIVSTPSLVRIRHEPLHIASGYEHTMLVTTDYKMMVCGNSKNNRFCDKDYDKKNIYNIRRFQIVEKDLLNDEKIAYLQTGDFHNLALTKDGRVLAWGGAVSENLSKRKSRLYDDKKRVIEILKGNQEAEEEQKYNTDLLQPFQKTPISMIACGDYHALAVEANSGTLWTWGGHHS